MSNELLTSYSNLIIVCHHAALSRARKLTLSSGDLPNSINFFHLCLFYVSASSPTFHIRVWVMYSQSPLICSSSVIPFLSWLVGTLERGPSQLFCKSPLSLSLAEILHFMNGVKPLFPSIYQKVQHLKLAAHLIYWSKWFLSDFPTLKLQFSL